MFTKIYHQHDPNDSKYKYRQIHEVYKYRLYVQCLPVQDVVAPEKVTPDAKHPRAADDDEEMIDESRPRNLLASLDDAAGGRSMLSHGPCCHDKL